MKNLRRILSIIALISIVLGIFCISQGFDKKNNYYNSTDYTSLNVNSYVGGDAYNYIINSNYFTGYLTLGSALLICGTLLGCSAVSLTVNGSRIKTNNLSLRKSKEPQQDTITPTYNWSVKKDSSKETDETTTEQSLAKQQDTNKEDPQKS